MSKYYIAGPMSGIPKFNYPAFFEAAEALRSRGYEVVSPAEMDSPDVQALALASTEGNLAELGSTGETWGDMLAADVKLIADEVDGVVLLPGWHRSRGACLEAYVCLTVQKQLKVYLGDGKVAVLCPKQALGKITVYLLNQGDTSRYKEAS